jgi:hypothetical protein
VKRAPPWVWSQKESKPCKGDRLFLHQLKQLLDNQHDPIEWISATRHKREMSSVNGSNGELDFKIGQSEFPNKLFIECFSLRLRFSVAPPGLGIFLMTQPTVETVGYYRSPLRGLASWLS